MEKSLSKTSTVLIGISLVVLGLLFLATLVNWIEFDGLYRTLIPILLIIAGFGMFSSTDNQKRRVGLGLGLFLAGAIALLVRFNVLSSESVSAVLGVILLVTGVIMLTVLADRISSDKAADKIKDNS